MGILVFCVIAFLLVLMFFVCLKADDEDKERERAILYDRISGIQRLFQKNDQHKGEFNGVIYCPEGTGDTPTDYIRGDWFSPNGDAPEHRSFYGVVFLKTADGYELIKSDNLVYVILND